MEQRLLRIGFPDTVAEADAVPVAVDRWHQAAARDGHRLAAGHTLTARVDRTSPDRAAVGEYVVEVTGIRSEPDGDQ